MRYCIHFTRQKKFNIEDPDIPDPDQSRYSEVGKLKIMLTICGVMLTIPRQMVTWNP